MRTVFAQRLSRMGVETAFAVSDDARAWGAKGHKIYPFHLGDMNIRTPLNIIEAAHKAALDGKTGYCPAAGIPELREAIAADVAKDRGVEYTMENVSVQPGGKPIIGKFLMTLMQEGDEVFYPNPGYPIYESQIFFLGGRGIPYGYTMTPKGFRINRDQIEHAVTPRTRIFIYNNGQNPLGAESDDEEMEWLARFCVEHDLWLLSDEAYFHIRYSGKSKSIVSLPEMQERTVILYVFSKTFAMTGWRLGAAVGPQDVIHWISKLNVNQESCTNHFIQYAGIEALQNGAAGTKEIIATLKERRDALAEELKKIRGVDVYVPEVTFYLFPDVTDIYKRRGITDRQDFRKDALRSTGVSFCSRSHFGRAAPNEPRTYIRFAYSGIDTDQIREGIGKLREYWDTF
ncbi:MAG: aminotransferase class I/II-fold pyridoxal phosphate-dependent enzyme [Kiritimatiellae bacterium]|nr:aminotransferase class I/II-fold pyridoxal phosphate-dependent enzyme [Kiritimatiellia bacterium]